MGDPGVYPPIHDHLPASVGAVPEMESGDDCMLSTMPLKLSHRHTSNGYSPPEGWTGARQPVLVPLVGEEREEELVN